MKKLIVLVVAALATTACAPDLPEAPVGPDEKVEGALIDQTVIQAATAAQIADCPAPSAEGAASLSAPALVCVSSGKSTDLGSFAGTPTVVNVWAHWCTECREELPALAEASRLLEGKVQFVGVLFADENPGSAVQLAADSGLTFPLLADRESALRYPLQLRGLPQTVFLDASGDIVAVEYSAYTDTEDVMKAVQSRLGVSP